MNRTVRPRKLKVISVCSICGEPVNTNKDDLAYRHGFKRIYFESLAISLCLKEL